MSTAVSGIGCGSSSAAAAVTDGESHGRVAAGPMAVTNAELSDSKTNLATLSHYSGIAGTATDGVGEGSVNVGLDNGDGQLNGNGNCFSLTLMQSSPPPHSYRHSRAYRHFKNPPQPHMCIRTTTEAGEELFINVLSWTRIVIPQEPSDPIPLYGGMRVPPGSPRSPPIVFAVMANPEVLKDSGRHSKDPEERRAMVELMCDFVEAMNPGVKLVRNAVILKDRDISGELKDVWNAVQAQRDREREEQMLQQRQQQHYHNVTTQQMFPKATEAVRTNQQRHIGEGTLANMSPEKAPSDSYMATISANGLDDAQLDNRTESANVERNAAFFGSGLSAFSTNASDSSVKSNRGTVERSNSGSGQFVNNLIESKDQIDANNRLNADDELSLTATIKQTHANTAPSDTASSDESSGTVKSNAVATTATPTTVSASVSIAIPAPTTAIATSTATTTATPTTPIPTTTSTKKEKLAGFLPNGCIFPRFKNNKHKEKDKDKEKEAKPKDKEKTLLNALKKSKEKKVAPIEQSEKTSPETDAKSNYEKNCINLENEVQKLDLNKIESSSGSDNNMFIKLKVTATSAAAK